MPKYKVELVSSAVTEHVIDCVSADRAQQLILTTNSPKADYGERLLSTYKRVRWIEEVKSGEKRGDA